MLDKITHTFTCPKCGNEFSKSLRELEAIPEFPCPGAQCTASITVTLKGIDEVKQLDESLASLKREFKKFGGKITIHL